MPYRVMAAQRLAKLFAALSHPARVSIISELRKGELCVNSLQELLGISHSGVSQHLAVLRSQKIIREHRAGRHVYYEIAATGICSWLAEAIPFIMPDDNDNQLLRSEAAQTLNTWRDDK